MSVLETARLRLEPMSEAHYVGLRVLNGDPEVMRYITGAAETPEETHAVIARVQERWARFGYSWWSFIERQTGELVGAGCIQHLRHDPANPHEIGWRLRPNRWGMGYALEAAQRMARFAFEDLEAPLLCAVCDRDNERSAHLMRKLGMRLRGEEVWDGYPVLLYEIDRAGWERNAA